MSRQHDVLVGCRIRFVRTSVIGVKRSMPTLFFTHGSSCSRDVFCPCGHAGLPDNLSLSVTLLSRIVALPVYLFFAIGNSALGFFRYFQ